MSTTPTPARSSKRLSHESQVWSKRFDWGKQFDLLKRYQLVVVNALEKAGWEPSSEGGGPGVKTTWKILSPEDELNKKGQRYSFLTLTPIIQYCWGRPKWRPLVEEVLRIAQEVDGKALSNPQTEKLALSLLRELPIQTLTAGKGSPAAEEQLELLPPSRKRRTNNNVTMVAKILAGMADVIQKSSSPPRQEQEPPPAKQPRVQSPLAEVAEHQVQDTFLAPHLQSQPQAAAPPSNFIVLCPGAPAGARYKLVGGGGDTWAQVAPPKAPTSWRSLPANEAAAMDQLVQFLSAQGPIEQCMMHELLALVASSEPVQCTARLERVQSMLDWLQRCITGLSGEVVQHIPDGCAPQRARYEVAARSQAALENQLAEDLQLSLPGMQLETQKTYLTLLRAAVGAAQVRSHELWDSLEAARQAEASRYSVAMLKEEWKELRCKLDPLIQQSSS